MGSNVQVWIDGATSATTCYVLSLQKSSRPDLGNCLVRFWGQGCSNLPIGYVVFNT